MNLCIDQGNTTTKAGLFEDDSLVETMRVPNEGAAGLINSLKPDHCIISSVKSAVAPAGLDERVHLLILDHTTPLPIDNLYETPATLGPDRLAGAIGSLNRKPKGNNLVIDCGTCITFDFINDQLQYLGGGISPGVEMRFKALNTFTARLPLVEIEESVKLIGGSTKASILSGVLLGVVSEVEGIIGRYQAQFKNLSVFLCGGDAKYFESKLRGAIFVEPELVLYGLNEILRFNVEKN